MEARSVAGISASTGALNWIVRAVVAGVVLAGLLLTVNTFINAPEFWESIDRQNAAEIEQENQGFCGRFEMEPGTEAFESCAGELALMRQAHAKRLGRYRF